MELPAWFGTRVGDVTGSTVGTICDVYFDEATARPAWLLVDAARGPVLVPAAGASVRSDRVAVPHDAGVICSAPVVATPPPVLAGEPLLRMARHYGVRVDRCSRCVAVHGHERVTLAA
jgi:hypothetical protein